MGTGRVPLSTRSDQDLTILDPLAFPPPEHSIQGGDRDPSIFAIEQARDLRLGITALLLNTTEQGWNIHYSQSSSLDTFQKETSEILSTMARIIHIISPLSGTFIVEDQVPAIEFTLKYLISPFSQL